MLKRQSAKTVLLRSTSFPEFFSAKEKAGSSAEKSPGNEVASQDSVSAGRSHSIQVWEQTIFYFSERFSHTDKQWKVEGGGRE